MKLKHEEVYTVNDRASWLDVIAGCIVYLSLLAMLVVAGVGTSVLLG